MENKYIKYKYKYLQLKNKLKGGVGTPPKAGVLSTESDAGKASLAVESETDRMKAEEIEIRAQINALEVQGDENREIYELKMKLGKIIMAKMVAARKKAEELQMAKPQMAEPQMAKPQMAEPYEKIKPPGSISRALEPSATIKQLRHGTYGCAYTPPFKCINSQTCINSSMANSIRCVNGIGKVMNPTHAHDEFDIYDLLKVDEIDPEFRYHFPKPHMCNPDMVESQRAKCPAIDQLQTPVMLIYDNGKLDLEALLNKISKKDNISLLAALKQILRGLLNILEGIILFNKNSICHFDIKTTNITTSLSSSDTFHDLHMRMIDFGISIKYNVAITPGNIFNDINGHDFKRIKSTIENYYHYFNIDTLFVGLLDSSVVTDSPVVTDSNISYIENTVNIFFNNIERSSYYNLQILNLLYNHPQVNWTRVKVATELKDLYKTNTINAIILQYLKTHDYYQFALLLINICSIIKNKQLTDACIKFIYNTKSVHYNPFERCRSVDLIEHYNEFLRDVERI